MSRLRILIKMERADAYEMKAQALNDNPRLKESGISAFKFSGDKMYISDGDFSPNLPTPAKPEPGSDKPEAIPATGGRLRVVIRMDNADSYELKAQALNNSPRLEEAGISALKFVGDTQYIIEGDFSPDLPAPPAPEPASTPDKKLRLVLRTPTEVAYELVAKHLNSDPALAKAGISGVGLAKGAGMVPVVKEIPQQPAQTSAPAPLKKKPSFAGCLVALLVAGFIGVTGAGALFFLPGILNPPPAPVATTTAVVPITGPLTSTYTPFPATATLSPTATKATSTSTKLPTATITKSPTVQVVSCQAPELGTIIPGSANCRYGPGASYLYEYGLYQGDQVQILGRADTAFATWVYVQTESEFNIACWVSAELVEMDGEVACLEDIYPETGGRPIYGTDLFPAPSNVAASRTDNTVFISWTGYELAPGDRESEDSPRYLLELWTCQGGEIVLTPMGVFEEFASIADEGGCSEPSYGQVFLAHKDGYVGPSLIPWPP